MKKSSTIACLVLTGALTISGCTAGDDVATLGGTEGANANKSQADTARDMVKCLQEAGIDAEFNDWGSDQGDFTIQTTGVWAMSLGGDSGSMMSAGTEAGTEEDWVAAQRRLAPLVAKYDPSMAEAMGGAASEAETWVSAPVPVDAATTAVDEPEESVTEPPVDESLEIEEGIPTTPPYLIVGDQDYTEDFVACLEETGFTTPEYTVDPNEELRMKRLYLEPTTEWIRCARENGYPNIKDPDPPKADEYQTQPTAVLPADITEGELRALLEVCPNFDPVDLAAFDKEAATIQDQDLSYEEYLDLFEELYKKYPGALTPDIGFDAPGYNGDWTNTDTEALSDAEAERLRKLTDVLYEQQNAYYESQIPEESVTAG
ncbi:MAG: hypothetical protein LBE08_05500 [Bifidobacteriaceae bacterium]|jgi:hypothetical protein|nr:hypothetical protein [Bifidobacteriaceae bacterium]